MIEQKYIEFLKQNNADTIQHSSRTLLQHLIGTYELLNSWGYNNQICCVGLFHSIYGTQTFHTRLLQDTHRDAVKRLLGNQTEGLVYLFATVNRDDLFGNPKHGTATDTTSIPSLTPEQIRVLVQVEIANIVEQFPHRKHTSKQTLETYKQQASLAYEILTESAQQCVQQVLSLPMR